MMCKRWLILFVVAMAPVWSHEFWLQPNSYTGQTGDEIAIDWRIGSHFEGTPYVYLPSMAQQVAVINQQTRQELTPRFAAKPALNISLGPKTTIVITESTDFDIRYDNRQAFELFLEKEQLLNMVDLGGLAPNQAVLERYRRYAKTLLTVAAEPWQDQSVGLTYEWVIRADNNNLVGRLSYRGQPAVQHPVKLFARVGGKVVEWPPLMTDTQGEVLFTDLQPGAQYLLNAIRIEAIDPASNEQGAAWHSDWASTTFQWPGK